ncbi:MAG: hypothetical protein O3A25_14330, partial [Acidobacteria bacterium]|nr:hypothetical protein [Acidobacteriota bacterium]
MPIHRLAYPHEAVENGLQYRSVPSLEVDRLAGGSIKSSVLAELRGLGEHVPITPLVREYVEGLGVIHELFRSQAAPDVQQWDQVLVSMQERGVARWGGNEQSAFLAFHLHPDGRAKETIEVFTDLGFLTQTYARFPAKVGPPYSDRG